MCGGDRRSLARSDEARARILANPGLVGALTALTADDDWLVAMRAVDLLEKLAHSHPDWVAPWKAVFLGPLADREQWEIRLQVVRALPLFAWTAAQMPRVVAILCRDLDHPRTFVSAWAATGLASFAADDPSLRPVVLRWLQAAEHGGGKALRSRARALRRRWPRWATATSPPPV